MLPLGAKRSSLTAARANSGQRIATWRQV